MARQLIFDLPVKTAFGRDDFFASAANQLAVQALEDWPNWPLNKLVLTGPKGSGKSHLAAIWAQNTGAVILPALTLPANMPDAPLDTAICVEDVPQIASNRAAETALFHLHNLAQESGAPLLLTGSGAVSRWKIALPDLASRLQGSNMVALQEPDDATLSAVLIKLFADRQLRIEPGVIAYMTPRMERSFTAAQELVSRLDRRALQDKRPIGLKMVRHILETMETEAP